MIALIQRVKEARVEVNKDVVGQIGQGVLVLLGVEKGDDQAKAKRLCERVLNYRIFSDEVGKMNLSVKDIGGEILVVSQFTLVADTQKGNRPSFSKGASPEESNALYEYFKNQVKNMGVTCESGRFAVDMQVHLVNDGPVTFSLSI